MLVSNNSLWVMQEAALVLCIDLSVFVQVQHVMVLVQHLMVQVQQVVLQV